MKIVDTIRDFFAPQEDDNSYEVDPVRDNPNGSGFSGQKQPRVVGRTPGSGFDNNRPQGATGFDTGRPAQGGTGFDANRPQGGTGFDTGRPAQSGTGFDSRTPGGFDSGQSASGFDGGQSSDRSGSRITQRDRTTGRQTTESLRTPSRPANDFPQDSYPQDSNNKVVNIQATAQLQVVLVKPEVFTDAKQIADHLIAKKTVVLNLETASAENKRRIIDFLVGVAYANGGSLKPVANLTYIITPYNVGFIGEDLVNELETNGVIM